MSQSGKISHAEQNRLDEERLRKLKWNDFWSTIKAILIFLSAIAFGLLLGMLLILPLL